MLIQSISNFLISLFLRSISSLNLLLYQKNMQDFLGEGVSLKQFENQSEFQIFETAQQYPQFFDQYLKDDDRVIKVLRNDSHANQRIFYYQYLKLCFEAQQKDGHLLIQNIRDLIFNPDFYFVFDLDNPGQYENDSQYKRLIFEFMELIEEKGETLDRFLKKYPIIDQVLVKMLRSLLIFYGQANSIYDEVDRQTTFSTFQQIFGLSAHKFGNCIKFVDADVFVYQQSPQEVFMAYIQTQQEYNQDSVVYKDSEQQSLEIDKKLDVKNFLQTNNEKKKNQIYVSNTSSVYDFVDFTSPQYAGQNKMRDPLNLDQKDTSAFFQKNKNLQMSATLDRPFQHNMDKKMSISAIDPSAKAQINPQNSLQKFEPRLQQSIDIGYKIKQIKDKMIQESQTKQISNRNAKQTQQIQTKPSEASLAQMNSKSCFENVYFNNFQQANQIQIQTNNQIQPIQLNTHPQKFEQFEPKYKSKTQVQVFKPENSKLHKTYKHQIQLYQPQPIKLKTNETMQVFINKKNYIDRLENNYEQNIKSSLHQRIRLNVTKEFTNSAVLQKMPEKYRQNILKSRERARAYRKSIQNLL